ncbi:hypothetical protein CLAFUW4_12971 [Fulvia fulva]|uniref:uncharacterized protein n=1 Tax=Passalora fulva TaxID=5499 RepID=UPI0004E9F860|nr:uncharacterized protein CLAFUR5_20342 [Fulvia fulva]KAK4612129.1 hypothetical protein CLAFUR4_12975 [Fulvia fulva]KAK4613048.1 hypothetical protein CLAFUR0_12980 [Fulvia fulva]WMI39046.1 hypothetical protein CLAFUR5_20342 [Fulvia fulva]WPV21140.1 hypothetical protein CLAFUW4_12971 [Fulvia fulva]WPV36330.1 hypothetical protein CLAFUW7_12978 [Fulvia fulva]
MESTPENMDDPSKRTTAGAGHVAETIKLGTPIWVVMEHFTVPDPTVSYFSNFRGLFCSLEAATEYMKKLICASEYPNGYKTGMRYLQETELAEVFDSSALPLGLGYQYEPGYQDKTRTLWLQQELWGTWQSY